MKTLVSFLRSCYMTLFESPYKLFLALLSMLFLALLIWVGGNLLDLEGGKVQFVLIGCLAILGLILLLIGWYQVSKNVPTAAQPSQESPTTVGPDTRQNQREQICSVREKFEEAISALTHSILGSGQDRQTTLHALRWYLLIGPPGAGKSTMLRESGLQFASLENMSPNQSTHMETENCDWWFANDAVLLDTAGRYMTQDQSRYEWHELLKLLKSHRKETPINGVLVTISITDILNNHDDALITQATMIRKRLDEIVNRLGTLFPVYLVFTQCDVLDGFTEFFQDLPSVERNKVWGCTLQAAAHSHPASRPQIQFESEFQKLIDTLHAIRLKKTSTSLKPSAWKVYGFPFQFESCREPMHRFVEELFQANPYQENPMFRGFYFSSATQTGSPIDCFFSRISEAAGLPHPESLPSAPLPTKSYFIKKLFMDVVFPDRTRARPSRSYRDRTRRLRIGILITFFFGIGISAAWGWYSYQENSRILQTITSDIIKPSTPAPRKVQNNLETFKRCRTQLIDFHSYEQEDVPWELKAFYAGTDVLIPLRHFCLERFYQLIAKPAHIHVENQLLLKTADGRKSQTSFTHNEIFFLLRAYLMLADPEHSTSVALRQQLKYVWDEILGIHHRETEKSGDVLRTAIFREIDFYSGAMENTWGRNLSLDNQLIRKARSILEDLPTVQYWYNLIKVEASENLLPYTLAETLKEQSGLALTSNYGIPRLFTPRGWHLFQNALRQKIDEGNWVFGQSHSSKIDRETAITKLYAKEYRQHWKIFLESITYRPIGTESAINNLLDIISHDDSPIKALWVAIAANAQVKPISPYFQTFERLNGSSHDSESPSSLNQYLKELGSVHQVLRRNREVGLSSHDDTTQLARLILEGRKNEIAHAFHATQDILQPLHPEFRQAATALLTEPILRAAQAIMNRAMDHIDERWHANIYRDYQRHVANTYPFHKGKREASLQDVTNVLQETRLFYEKHLKAFVGEQQGTWTIKQWHGVNLPLTKNGLRCLQHADTIAQSLVAFEEKGVTFQIYPHLPRGQAARTTNEITLDINGQILKYRMGRQHWTTMKWEEPDQSTTVGVQINVNGTRISRDYTGEWAFFHLLESGRVRRKNSTTYLLEFDMPTKTRQDLSVSYSLKADSYRNPFAPDFFQSLSCPSHIGTSSRDKI